MSGFDWGDLRFFLAVARAGRLTVAARHLGVDHATVSRRIQALEHALRAPLFERAPRGYVLTPHGEQLFAKAEAMESLALTAQAEVAGAGAALSGAVRIGAPDGFGVAFLAGELGALCAQHPGLEVQLEATPRIFSVIKREIDIAITVERPSAGRLQVRKLTDYSLRLYAARSWLAQHDPPSSLAALSQMPLIGYIDDLIFSPALDYLPQLVGDGVRPQLASSNVLAQYRACEAGAGLCVLHDFMAVGNPNLVPVLADQVRFLRSYWLVTHADSADLARVRCTADFIVDRVRHARAQFMPGG